MAQYSNRFFTPFLLSLLACSSLVACSGVPPATIEVPENNQTDIQESQNDQMEVSAKNIVDRFPPGTFKNSVPVRDQVNGKTIDFVGVGTTVHVMETSEQADWKKITTVGWVPNENIECDRSNTSCIIKK